MQSVYSIASVDWAYWQLAKKWENMKIESLWQKLKKVQREQTLTKKNKKNLFKVRSIKSETRLKIDNHEQHGRQEMKWSKGRARR